MLLLFFFIIIIALARVYIVMCAVQSSGRALRTSVNRRVYLYARVWKTPLWRSLVLHPSATSVRPIRRTRQQHSLRGARPP